MRLQPAVDEPIGRRDKQRTGGTRAGDRPMSDERHGRQRWRRRLGRFESVWPAEPLWRRWRWRLRREPAGRRDDGGQGDIGRRRRWRNDGRGRRGISQIVRRIASDRRQLVERGHVPGQGAAARRRGAGRGPKFGPRALGVDQVGGWHRLRSPSATWSVDPARPHLGRRRHPFASLLGQQLNVLSRDHIIIIHIILYYINSHKYVFD